LDAADAGFAVDEAIPDMADPASKRRNQAQSCNDNPSHTANSLCAAGSKSSSPGTRRTAAAFAVCSGVFLDEIDRILDGDDLLRRVVGNLATEFLFKGHHQFHRVQAVGAQIVDETRGLGNLCIIDAQMLDDDLLH